jgi:ABC-type glycerol-3-phosphate transport system substrate-binding protein
MFDCFEKIYLGHNGVPNSTKSHVYPFTYPPGTENGYVLSFLKMTMAQYNVDEYKQFMTFTDEDGFMREDGYEMFNTQSVYEMFKMAYRLMDYQISSPGTTTQTLDGAQAQVMRDGGAVFMPNGDWFLNEVKLNYKNNLQDVDFINYPVSSALGVRLFGAGTSYNKTDAVCEEWLSYIIDCADEGKTADEIVALMASAKAATVAKADVQAVCDARGMRTMASTANTNMMITKGSTKKDIAALFCRMIASNDAADTIFQYANSNSAYATSVRTNSQYKYLNSVSKVMNRAGAIVIDKDPSGYRKAMGVSSVTPLKGHLQGALAVYTAGYYTKGGIADGASLSIYDTDARTAQQAEYQNAKNNWSKWLTNAGL